MPATIPAASRSAAKRIRAGSGEEEAQKEGRYQQRDPRPDQDSYLDHQQQQTLAQVAPKEPISAADRAHNALLMHHDLP